MTFSHLILLLSVLLLISPATKAQKVIVSTDSATAQSFLKASRAYMSGDYMRAIPLYRSILSRDTLLTRDFWYVLIDNLGMAYGITGDLHSSAEVFRYGISKDSTYPLFYYNLACGQAEASNLDSCIYYLGIAFRFKGNTMAGEPFPDPAKDDSFQRFMKNEAFLSALREFRKK